MSPIPTFKREASEDLGQESTEVRITEEQGPLSYCSADLGEAGAPMRRGVLGSTFGEASSCPADDELFQRPFDMEARALKILGYLLLVRSRGIRECHGVSFSPSLDKEGERMLREFLPDVWQDLSKLEEGICLIDGCISQAKYPYHMLGECVCLFVGRPHVWDLFGMSHIMDKEKRRKIIAAGKRFKETGVAQVSCEVLRPDTSVPSMWEFLEEAFTKARSMAREWLEVKLE
ncbi:hypothetical protein ACLOJK_036554 [Asimina triloba]